MNPFLKIDVKLKRNNFQMVMKVEIPKGIIGIYGPSGHGKTSLLNSIAGIVKPNDGYIYINKEPVFDASKKLSVPVKKRKIGYVFQQDRLFPHLSILKNLTYAYSGSGKIKVDDVIDILEIKHLLGKFPEECSGGERQRVAIGRALLSNPDLILMDEPFSAVDNRLRKDIIPYLICINKEYQIPMLIVSHELADLISLTDYIILLYNGKILDSGKFHDLIANEKNITLLQGTGIFNGFDLSVFAFHESKDIVLLKGKTNNFLIQAMKHSFKGDLKLNEKVRILIRPEDISLSLSPISGISLRNQVEGIIEKIIEKDGFSFCLVDAGEKILVEITEASRFSLGLNPGLKVFCLFKSVSLKIY